MQRSGLGERLGSLSASAMPPKPDDLFRMWSLVRECKPKFILEYGSGCSTVVMADAMKCNTEQGQRPGQILSIEGHREWRDHTTRNLHPDDRKFVEVRHCHPSPVRKRIQLNRHGEKFWYPGKVGRTFWGSVVALEYEAIRDLAPDFIYLDGPDPASVEGFVDDVDGSILPPVVIDLLSMEQRLKPGTSVLIDGRGANAWVLWNNLQRDWSCRTFNNQDCTLLTLRG